MDVYAFANISYAISDFIYETDWDYIFFLAKIISGSFSIVFFIGVIILAVKINLLGQAAVLVSEAMNVSAVPKRRFAKKWEGIQKKFKKGDDASMRLAVIEVDKMFDELVQRMGYHGKTMGERLEKIDSGQFPRIQEIWDAHKLRNSIVHDADFTLAREDAEKAIRTYEAVLKDLEVI